MALAGTPNNTINNWIHSDLDVKKAGKFFDVSFLNFHIYFVSEQGNRFGAKAISLGYLGYLNF